MAEDIYSYKSDCAYFKGDAPCKPHKNTGVKCVDCEYYEKKEGIILIIKLGAIGDVIRTTPLLTKLWETRPDKKIWFLTYSPDIIPSKVDKIFPMNPESILVLRNAHFDEVINLDKDLHACALAKELDADKKTGFILKNGVPAPVDVRAEHKFRTGLFDDLNQSVKKSYPEEMFEICGFKYNKEEYILEIDESINWSFESHGLPVVGLNTGCGARWTSRLLPQTTWEDLTRALIENGYYPLLLGGEQEHEKNMEIAEKTRAHYPGHFSLPIFTLLMNRCDIVVTAVTMGLHIAIGLKKRVVLMNNIFNPNEFELFGRGEIVQPPLECKCFFSPRCRNDEYFCMESLTAAELFKAVERQKAAL